MINKIILSLGVGVLLMGSSRVIPAPIYVHCNSTNVEVEQSACQQLVNKLRDRKLRRSVAMLKDKSARSGTGLHITLHIVSEDPKNFKTFLSWGSGGNQSQTVEKGILIQSDHIDKNMNKVLDSLISTSNIPL